MENTAVTPTSREETSEAPFQVLKTKSSNLKVHKEAQIPGKKQTKKRRPGPSERAAQSFPQRKRDILKGLNVSSCDLSPKGSVDIKCQPIIHLLNSHPEYVTTSSCSGRIALFHSSMEGECDEDVLHTDGNSASAGPGRKRGGTDALGWLLVKHGMLLPQEMQLVVDYLCGEAKSSLASQWDSREMAKAEAVYATRASDAWYSGELEGVLVPYVASRNGALPPFPSTGTVSLKVEPFVLHVQCLREESAKRLLSAAIGDSGFRNSGMIPPGKRIMCGIRTTTGLSMEVPLILDGNNYLQPLKSTSNEMSNCSCCSDSLQGRAYLWALLRQANKKMCHNEEKIKLLNHSIERRLMEATEAEDD